MNAAARADAITQAKALHKLVSNLKQRTSDLVRRLTKPIVLPADGRTDYHTAKEPLDVDQIRDASPPVRPAPMVH